MYKSICILVLANPSTITRLKQVFSLPTHPTFNFLHPILFFTLSCLFLFHTRLFAHLFIFVILFHGLPSLFRALLAPILDCILSLLYNELEVMLATHSHFCILFSLKLHNLLKEFIFVHQVVFLHFLKRSKSS